MKEPGKTERQVCPRVPIRSVETRMWYAMGAIEVGNAITVGLARPTLGKQKGRQCMG